MARNCHISSWSIFSCFFQFFSICHRSSRLFVFRFISFPKYSYGHSLTYGYLISPMKMRSLWEGKTYAKNTTSPLNLCYILKRGLDLSILKIWGLLVKGLQSYQLSKLEVSKKSLPYGPGPSRPVCPGSIPGEVKSFSKFDGRSFCSPLTYRPQIFNIWRSKSFQKCVEISKGYQHFKGGFCPLKGTSFT